MEKLIGGVSQKQVDAEFIHAVEFEAESGYRWWVTGTYDKTRVLIIGAEAKGHSVSDCDIAVRSEQPKSMQPFFDEMERLCQKHGWMTFPDLFERFGVPA